MYLASHNRNGIVEYSLRVSLFDEKQNTYVYKNVFDLGSDPSSFIHEEFAGCIFFDDSMEKAVSHYTKEDSSALLEKLLFKFFSFESQQHYRRYPSRETITASPLSGDELKTIDEEVSLFDKKRLYFLRYGAVDQAHLHKMHSKLCRKLLWKSRDEKECDFIEQEAELSVTELKTYVYAIFNLQDHFSQSFAPFMPGALPQDEVADAFIEEICCLNSEKQFFLGEPTFSGLYHHLQRYVIMFFDHEYESHSFENDFIRQFRQAHSAFKWPAKKEAVDDAVIAALFDKSVEQLLKMSKRKIGRLYRQKAKILHPDKGGDHEKFIELTNAYNQIIAQLN